MSHRREPRYYLPQADEYYEYYGAYRGQGTPRRLAYPTQYTPQQPQHTQLPSMHDGEGRRNFHYRHEIYTQASRLPTQHTQYAGYTPQDTTEYTQQHTAGYTPQHSAGYTPQHSAGYTPQHSAGYTPQHTAGYRPQHTAHAATPMPSSQRIRDNLWSSQQSLKTPQLNQNPENLKQTLHMSTQVPENFKHKRQKFTQTEKQHKTKFTQSQNCSKPQKWTQTPEKPKQKQATACTQTPDTLTQVTQTSWHPQEQQEQLTPPRANPRGTVVKPEKQKPIPETSGGLTRQLGTILDNIKKAQARIENNESLERGQKPLGDKTQEHTRETAQSSNEPTDSANEPDPSEDAVVVKGFIRQRPSEQTQKHLGNEWQETLKPAQPEERKPKLVHVIKYLIQCTKLPLRRQRCTPHKPKPLYPWQHVSETTQLSQHTETQALPMKKAEAQQPTQEPQPPTVVEKDMLPLIHGASRVETCTEDEDMMAFLMPTPSKEVKDIVTLSTLGSGACKDGKTNERQSEQVGNLDKHEENLTGAVMAKQSEPKKKSKKPKGILKKPKGEAEPKEVNLSKSKEIFTKKKPEPMKEPSNKGILKTPKKVFETKEIVTVYSNEQPRKVISENKVEQKVDDENVIEPEIEVMMARRKPSKLSVQSKPNFLSDSTQVSPKKVRYQGTSRTMHLEKETSAEETTTFTKAIQTEKPEHEDNEAGEVPPVSLFKVTLTESPVCEEDDGEVPPVSFSKMTQTENFVCEEDEGEMPLVSPVLFSKMTQTESPACQEGGVKWTPPISCPTLVTQIDFTGSYHLISPTQESQALETPTNSSSLEINNSEPQSINKCHQRGAESQASAEGEEASSLTSHPSDCTAGDLSGDGIAYLMDDQESLDTSQHSPPGQQNSKDYELDMSWFRTYQYLRRKNKLEELYKRFKTVQHQLSKQADRLQKTVNVPENKEDLTCQVQNLNQQMESAKVNLRAAMDEEKKNRKCCEELSNNLQGIKRERKKLLSDRELLQKEINLTQQEKFNLDARKCYQQSRPTSRQEQKGEYLKRYEHDLTLRVSKTDETVEANRREIYNMERNQKALDIKRRECQHTIKAISCKILNIKKKQQKLVELHNNILTAKANTHKIKRFRAHARNIKQQVSRVKEVINTLQEVPADKYHHIPTLAAALPDAQKQAVSWTVTEQTQRKESKEQELSGHHLLGASDVWRVSTFQSKHRPRKTSTRSWTVEPRDAAPRYVVIRVSRNNVWAVTDNTRKSRFE